MIIEQYNPNWLLKLKRLKKVYVNTFGEFILGVEHIGSTAVPGVKEKDVPVFETFKSCCLRLSRKAAGVRNRWDIENVRMAVRH